MLLLMAAIVVVFPYRLSCATTMLFIQSHFSCAKMAVQTFCECACVRERECVDDSTVIERITKLEAAQVR